MSTEVECEKGTAINYVLEEVFLRVTGYECPFPLDRWMSIAKITAAALTTFD